MTKTVALRVGVVVCLLSLLSPTTAIGQQVLYGASSGADSALLTINPATGAATAIGSIGIGVGAMAVHPRTGVLYGVTAPGFIPPSGTTRQLLRIDTRTGVGSVIGPLGATGFRFGIADLAFRSDGTLFGWSENSDDLITIDINTGAATIVGNAGISTFGSGLAFDNTGTLYLAGGGGNGRFYTVNPATGLTTLLGNLTGCPFPGFPIPAMKFHPVTNVLYAINRTFPPVASGALITINPTTRVCTSIGPTALRLDALAWGPPPSTTPFPPTITTPLTDLMVPQNGVVNVPFTITGAVIASALHVSLASSNTTLLPVSPSTLSANCTGSGACTLHIAPADGRAGTSQVTVTVNDGAQSTSTTFTVTVVAVRPSTPGVALANVLGSGVVVTWSPSDTGPPMAYAIAWGTSHGASNMPTQLVPGTSTRFEFPSLPAGTYFFRVHAVGSGDLSGPSLQEASATVGPSGAPGPPVALVGFPENASVNASWTAPQIGTTPTLYEVHVGSRLGQNDIASTTTAALSFNTAASPGSYWVRTRAASGGSVGAWSSSIQMPVGNGACAGPPGTPILLPVTTSSGLVTFTWWPGSGVVNSYQVLIEPGLGLQPVATIPTGGPATSFASTVTAAGAFAARVVAVNACGSSPPSNELAFTIQP